MRRILLLLAGTLTLSASDAPQFSSDGQLSLPKNYREWVFLTSGLGMTYGSPEAAKQREPNFDNVFVTPAAYQAFQKTGKWPDKTILILEVRASQANASINKAGRTQGDLVAVEAEVKNGGKWQFYGFGKEGTSAKPIPATAACYSCHGEHGAVDNTFVQFYPTLLSVAREKGTLRR
jgi:hypothetical protein